LSITLNPYSSLNLRHQNKQTYQGVWGIVVVKVLRYKSEGPGIDSRCRRGFFRGIWQFYVPWGRLSL
jgi:hypothetical protein